MVRIGSLASSGLWSWFHLASARSRRRAMVSCCCFVTAGELLGEAPPEAAGWETAVPPSPLVEVKAAADT